MKTNPAPRHQPQRGIRFIRLFGDQSLFADQFSVFRIQRACQLLRHSQLPVGAVAVSVGFEDPFYFSRTFRRETGVSPTEYRESKKDTGG